MVGLPTSATASIARSVRLRPSAHRPVADDVLDHDDGVVDQDADREDQREEADAVDRVAHQPGGEEREEDRRRDDDEHDKPLAPADREGDQHDDRDRRQAQVEEQLVRLLGGGRAVVASDGDLDVRGDDAALDGVEAPQHLVGDDDGVGALALGNRDSDGRAPLHFAVGERASWSRRDARARPRRPSRPPRP